MAVTHCLSLTLSATFFPFYLHEIADYFYLASLIISLSLYYSLSLSLSLSLSIILSLSLSLLFTLSLSLSLSLSLQLITPDKVLGEAAMVSGSEGWRRWVLILATLPLLLDSIIAPSPFLLYPISTPSSFLKTWFYFISPLLDFTSLYPGDKF